MSIVVPSIQKARILLNESVSDLNIRKHCEATREKALQIAIMVSVKKQINFQLIEVSALLHDIGRARVHDVTHGYVGGKILQHHLYPWSVVRIVERHVLGGFSDIEADMVGLPKRDFVPQTWEEKIVCVADKLGVFEWAGIRQPLGWLAEVNDRFARLSKRYGLVEPFKASMKRARRFTEELAALAILD